MSNVKLNEFAAATTLDAAKIVGIDINGKGILIALDSLLYSSYRGVAITSTDPGTPANPVFYFALPGTYDNFKDADAAAITINATSGDNTVLFGILVVQGAVSSKVEVTADIASSINELVAAGLSSVANLLLVNGLAGPFDGIAVDGVITGHYYDVSGVLQANAGYNATHLIEVYPDNQEIRVTVKAGGGGTGTICFYDASHTFISCLHATTDTYTNGVVTPPTGTKYIALSDQNADPAMVFTITGKKYILLNQVQEMVDLGYVDVDKTPRMINGGYIDHTGAFVSYSGIFYTDYIAMDASNERCFLTIDAGNALLSSIAFYDTAKAFLGYSQSVFANAEAVMPTGTKYIRLSQNSTNAVTVTSKGAKKAALEQLPTTLANVVTNTANEQADRFIALGQTFATRSAIENSNANYGIIMLGQSNMVGLAPYSSIASLGLPTTTTRVDNFDPVSGLYSHYNLPSSTNWGVWWSILCRLDGYLAKPIKYYRNAGGATSLYGNWNTDKPYNASDVTAFGTMTAKDIVTLKTATPAPYLKCVVWVQGENDNVAPYDALYYQNLKNFIGFLRGVTGVPDLKFVCVGVHKNSTQYDQVTRDGMVKACAEDANNIFINPDTITFTTVDGGLHYDGVYCEALGTVIFNQIKDL